MLLAEIIKDARRIIGIPIREYWVDRCWDDDLGCPAPPFAAIGRIWDTLEAVLRNLPYIPWRFQVQITDLNDSICRSIQHYFQECLGLATPEDLDKLCDCLMQKAKELAPSVETRTNEVAKNIRDHFVSTEKLPEASVEQAQEILMDLVLSAALVVLGALVTPAVLAALKGGIYAYRYAFGALVVAQVMRGTYADANELASATYQENIDEISSMTLPLISEIYEQETGGQSELPLTLPSIGQVGI